MSSNKVVANHAFSKGSPLMMTLTFFCILLFGSIAFLIEGKNESDDQKKNKKKSTSGVDSTTKFIIENSSFFIATVLLINALNRLNPSKVQQITGGIFINATIAGLLLYMSSYDTDGKELIKKYAKFAFVYLTVWKVMAPVLEITSNNSNNINTKRSYGMVIMYLIGMFQLIFMKLYKQDGMTVMKHGESYPFLRKAVNDPGLLIGTAFLFFMAFIAATK